jgi:putative copper resistance protein D
VAVLSVSGMVASVRFLGHAKALVSSAYGLTLVIKLVLLQVAFFAGLMNQRLIRPGLLSLWQQGNGLERESVRRTNALARGARLQLFNRYLELELAAGLLVITVAGIVGSVSPPGELGRQELTFQQVSALLQPHWPRTTWPDPATFCGAVDRASGDLLYSEFMHNWSGVAVLLLGCCWLIESQGGRWAAWAGRVWPCLLVPLGIFIAYASDPEVWLLRTMSFYEVLRDPQILEHQLGALLVFALAWFAWRDAGRSGIQRPLGYALPVIMIGGGLLLLGHAHSMLNSGDELTGLISVQHAILGGLGLLSGTVRWWGLRRLIPIRAAAWLWPGFVIALGVFMAFFYREAV